MFVAEDDSGDVVSRHLMAWQPAPLRAFATGVTGSARVLESWPDSGSRRSEEVLRIHVCRQKPCRARKTIPRNMDPHHARKHMDASSAGGAQHGPGTAQPRCWRRRQPRWWRTR